jgi:hypothetical protein
MARYRSRPTVIEAEQYAAAGDVVTGMCRVKGCFATGMEKPHVHTAHAGQVVYLELGDFVVPEPNGAGYYPIKPEIFSAKYELESPDGQPQS